MRALAEATVQEIQLELIRRTSFNELIGEQVHRSLLLHRELWTGVILDRADFSSDSVEPGRLLPMSLIKLRDIAGNFWNADTLFVLTPDRPSAERMGEIAIEELWEANDVHVYDTEEVAHATGCWPAVQGLVHVWWD